MHNIPSSVSIQIPTKVSSFSLVGVRDSQFPRGFGNYISVLDSENNITYEIINLSYEDLTDAIELNIIGETMEADVYDTSEPDLKVAFITDNRFPAKALSPRWWYSSRHNFKEAILRKEFNIYTDECLCKHPDIKFKFMSNTRIMFSDENHSYHYVCVCGNSETVYKTKT